MPRLLNPCLKVYPLQVVSSRKKVLYFIKENESFMQRVYFHTSLAK
ncbi:hypothetical protein HNQ38_000765 [Desulfovibrio intestinalis]|uniref:Uncharacterized protein n=1 Tax=Desulfovibrio intestinalis TaxID=58621 RepID=A0A7W8FFA4_9BACT|nr:hypothetical protein [Desulfovibrio intestinalis]